MNRKIYFSFVITIVALGFFISVSVSMAQQQDIRGYSFDEGVYKATNPASPSFQDAINMKMFEEAVIAIDKEGNITGSANAVLTDGPPLSDSFKGLTGTAVLSLTGTYDSGNATVDGNFTVKQSTFRSDKFDPENPSLILRTVTSNIDFGGTFEGDYFMDGLLTINFSGTQNATDEIVAKDRHGAILESADSGKSNSSKALTYTVHFNDQKNEPLDYNYKLSGGLTRGTAQLSRDKGSEWLDIDKDKAIEIKPGDTIRTGPNTRLLIKYDDGSVFRLKSNSKLTILPYGVILEYGGATFGMQKQGKKFKVVTPTTVCGVLGTTFSVDYAEETGESLVYLMEGSVEITITGSNEVVLLQPGEKISVMNSQYTKNTFDHMAMLEIENKELKDEPVVAKAQASPDTVATKKETKREPEKVTAEDTGDSGNYWWLIIFLSIVIVVIIVFVKRYFNKK